jgi:hypothetical protein
MVISGFIFDFSLNVAPKLISVLPSVTLRTAPASVFGNLFVGLQIKLNHLVKHYGEDYSKHLQYLNNIEFHYHLNFVMMGLVSENR